MAEAAVQSTGTGQKTGRAAAQDQEVTLERLYGWGGVFIFALCGIGLTVSGLLPFSTIAGSWPGADLVGVISVAAVIAMVHAYTYAAMGISVGRNGADYLLTSRVLNRPLAFAVSWTMVIFLALAGGAIIGSIFQNTLPMFARILSITFGNHLLIGYLETYSSQSGVVLFGSFGIMAVFAVLLLSPHMGRYFLLVGLILALGAWVIIALQFASSTSTQFLQSWEQTMGSGDQLEQLLAARSVGMRVRYGFDPTVLAGLAAGMALFFGYFHATSFAGEVKEPGKNLLRGSWLALLASWCVLALAAFFIQRTVTPEFLAVQSFLARLPEFQNAVMPWVPFYLLVVNPSLPLFWALAIAWILPSLAIAHTLLYASSRVVQAWAEEGLLPDAVNFFHPVLRSPLIAVLLVSIAAEVGLVFSALRGGFLGGANLVFIVACAQLFPVLALIVLPFRKKEWFQETPLARHKLGPIPLASLAGSISLIYLLWLIGTMLSSTGFQTVNQVTLILVGGLPATGLVWYIIQHAAQSATRAAEKIQASEQG